MSRSKGSRQDRRRDTEHRRPDERRDAKQREPDDPQAGQPGTEREAQDWARETGYRPSVNQRRHEPMPASHHADHGQEAVVRNEEQAGDQQRATPSPRARRRG